MSDCLHSEFYNYEDQGVVCTACGLRLKDSVSNLRGRVIKQVERIKALESENVELKILADYGGLNNDYLKDRLLARRIAKADRDQDKMSKFYAERIKALESELQAQEWVSVEDRLPDDKGFQYSVIAFIQYPNYQTVKVLTWVSSHKIFAYDSEDMNQVVTHWKPITPPTK